MPALTPIKERCKFATAAVKAYAKAKGEKYDDPSYITDLIADLLHLTVAGLEGDQTEAIEQQIRIARMHYEAEHTGTEPNFHDGVERYRGHYESS